MPIYEYRCKECGKNFEEMQKFSDKPIKTCKYCSGKNVEKLISASSFVLKGSGWHATDYGKKERPKKEAPCSAEGGNTSKPPSCAGCPSA